VVLQLERAQHGSGGGSGHDPRQSADSVPEAEAPREAAPSGEGAGERAGQDAAAVREAERQEIAGGETTEFSGDIGSCPEIVSNEPLDLDEPDVASWVALAQGHHEPTLGWRRAVSSDAVRGGEPTHACISGDYVTVTAPLTIATADGRVTLTQPITLELFFGNGAAGHGRTAWVPAGDFEAQMGLAGVKLVADSYGAVEFTNSVDWTEERLEGDLSVQKWEAFTEQPANYPTLQWCKGPNCFVEPER
jgi:hypothetical protein